MIHNVSCFEFTAAMTDVLPSTQKTWKVIPPEVGGYDPKALDLLCRAGQPFLIVGKIGAGHNGHTVFTTYLEYVDGLYYIGLHGVYLNVNTSTMGESDILLQYDPVLKILKGRRP